MAANSNILNISRGTTKSRKIRKWLGGTTYPACKQRVSKCDIVIGNWERVRALAIVLRILQLKDVVIDGIREHISTSGAGQVEF